MPLAIWKIPTSRSRVPAQSCRRTSIDLDPRTLKDARAAGLNAVNVTLGYVGGPEEPYEYTIRTIAMWDAELRAHPDDLVKVWTAADILRAKPEDHIGIIYGFQNAAMVGKTRRGSTLSPILVCGVIQLTYNPANQLGDGSMAPDNRGLTDLGREVVARLNESA